MPGGASWCEKWLSFDNEYFRYKTNVGEGKAAKGEARGKMLWLPTDAALHEVRSYNRLWK